MGRVEENIMFGSITVTQHTQRNATSITVILPSFHFYPDLKYLYQTCAASGFTLRIWRRQGDNTVRLAVTLHMEGFPLGECKWEMVYEELRMMRLCGGSEHVRKQNQKASWRVIKSLCSFLNIDLRNIKKENVICRKLRKSKDRRCQPFTV